MLTVTVFTPTYNRAHVLERLYRSLQEQSFKDFEWLIVDDGSTDHTGTLVSSWKSEQNRFPIRYYWKPNGGKHTAHNYALEKARGEYLAIMDSDDWYTPDALEILTNAWNAIPGEMKSRFSNIEGLCSYQDGTIIGKPWPREIYDISGLEVRKIRKDTMGIYRLSILKKYPFPNGFDGCFVLEGLIWNRIADKYLTRFINRVVGYKEYLEDGLTKRPLVAKLAGSRSGVLFCREMSSRRSESYIRRVIYAINVYRYTFHSGLSFIQELKKEKSILFGIAFVSLGYLAYLKDRFRIAIEKATKPN